MVRQMKLQHQLILYFFLLMTNNMLFAQQKDTTRIKGEVSNESPIYVLGSEKSSVSIECFDADLKMPISTEARFQNIALPKDSITFDLSPAFNTIELPAKQTYVLSIKAKGFVSQTDTLDTNTDTKQAFYLIPQKRDFEIVINDFDANKDEVEIKLINKNKQEQIIITGKDGKDGHYFVKIRSEDEYDVEIKNNKQLVYYKKNIPPKSNTNSFQLKHFRYEINDKIYLKDITFATNSTELNPHTQKELAPVIEMLQQNPTMRLRIEGHTDDIGDSQKNMNLSIQRAEKVRLYLAENQIDAQRLEIKGYGEDLPTMPNTTEEGRAANRRFELVIIGI
ncbi:MAG: OmpA family protein [Cytophagales bacterium]|nr:MAG: OmpA family protein [Cytophagales bacterium]